jgi:recombinational DNA repair protein (RecF pathway)
MEPIISDRFERCADCGAVIRPKDQCAREDDLFYCCACYEKWLESLMHVDGPPPEDWGISDEEMQEREPDDMSQEVPWF